MQTSLILENQPSVFEPDFQVYKTISLPELGSVVQYATNENDNYAGKVFFKAYADTVDLNNPGVLIYLGCLYKSGSRHTFFNRQVDYTLYPMLANKLTEAIIDFGKDGE